jgi:putative PIN family toxin of toxin-antitoxin system
MKIVIDSNIFVSSLIWGGNPRKVFDRVTNGLDELYISDEILDELMNVMSREKFKLKKQKIEEYKDVIEHFSIKVFPNSNLENISRDIDDNKILIDLLGRSPWGLIPRPLGRLCWGCGGFVPPRMQS